ncbi:DJ-1/PfpI family protein [Mycoplasma sp. Ms02]|uniref:DJ-1/PfpI family protein n=1 Tax=Mycoplasma sp. Ms02 TaxID=353851 RepID=UPI001C8A88FE|nr:DJ-1/PfpI family protein [Mycoplasma sp. Ms02]QZE12258.1 DJ-1/PfpI family protein [Mycoplasma sp. Ms02]
MKKKMLVLTFDKFNDVELITFVSTLKRADILDQITYVSAKKGILRSQYDNFDLSVEKFSDDISEYDAVYVPGGPAAQELRSNLEAQKLVQKFVDQGKFVFAICDAPNALKEANVLQDLKYTAFPSDWSKDSRDEFYNPNKLVIQSNDKIATGRSAGATLELALLAVKMLSDEESYKKAYFGMLGENA